MVSQQIFLEMDTQTAADPDSPYAVLPLPYERSVTFGTGTSRGPAAILSASQQIEDFDEEFQAPIDLRVQTLPPLEFKGVNDEQSMARITQAAQPILGSGRFLMSFGGEHTVTAPLVAAAKAVYGRLHVLHIDAHTDLRFQYSGTKFSHACVMRRVREMGVPTVHVGVRSMSREEHEYVEREKVSLFWASDLAEPLMSKRIEEIVNLLGDSVYITVDVDAFDPSLVPGTGTPEPGGMTWQQVTKLLKAVFYRRRVIAADIVEVVPISGSVVSEFVAARLAEKMLMYHKYRRA